MRISIASVIRSFSQIIALTDNILRSIEKGAPDINLINRKISGLKRQGNEDMVTALEKLKKMVNDKEDMTKIKKYYTEDIAPTLMDPKTFMRVDPKRAP